MKKLLSILLTVTMLLSLCLCFAGCETEDIRGTISSDPTESQEPSKPNNEPEFGLGNTTGHTYKNDFLGISCTLPAQWEFATEEQLLEMNNLAGDYMDEDVAELLKNATIIYDMSAQYLDEGSSISVNMEKLNALQLLNLNIKQVLEGQIPGIISTYENIGYTDVTVVYEKITVDGTEFDGLRLNAKIQGLDMNLVLFSFLKGSYLANVTVGSLRVETITEVLDAITIE